MRRKKSKYKHAVIGKKKYYLQDRLEDPCGDAGHADVDEVKTKTCDYDFSSIHLRQRQETCLDV